MNRRRNGLVTILLANSLMYLLFSSSSGAARADDDSNGLTMETAMEDVGQPVNQNAVEQPVAHVLLYGSAFKHGAQGGASAEQNATCALQAPAGNAALKAEQAAQDAYKLAVAKLESGADMTSDDFRALGLGCTGLESNKVPGQKYSVISDVYPGFPAANAGIRNGEKMIWPNDKSKPGDKYEVVVGKVGQLVPITVIRHGKPVDFELVDQNVEDIAIPRVRKEWEDLIRSVGSPKDGGTFTGQSLQSLEPAE